MRIRMRLLLYNACSVRTLIAIGQSHWEAHNPLLKPVTFVVGPVRSAAKCLPYLPRYPVTSPHDIDCIGSISSSRLQGLSISADPVVCRCRCSLLLSLAYVGQSQGKGQKNTRCFVHAGKAGYLRHSTFCTFPDLLSLSPCIARFSPLINVCPVSQ